jgi:hypothetical protein
VQLPQRLRLRLQGSAHTSAISLTPCAIRAVDVMLTELLLEFATRARQRRKVLAAAFFQCISSKLSRYISRQQTCSSSRRERENA